MRNRRMAAVGFFCGLTVIGACGDEIAREQAPVNAPPERPACELIEQIDLQQIFVNSLTADGSNSSNRQCTWNDSSTSKPFVQYRLHPYVEDLQTRVDAMERDTGGSVNPRFVQGIGDAAVWTDAGLFVNRNGRTLQVTPLQVTPLQDAEERAPYQELARLLLTRLEGR